MISERIPDPNEDGAWQPNSGREQKRLDLALADPEGFVAQMLTKHDRQRRTRLVWMCLTGFGLLMCSALFIAVIALMPNSVLGSDKATTAWKLWQSRKLPEAEAKFREVLMEDDKNSNAWNGLGWCLCNMGRPTEAIVAFKKCLDLEPTHPAALNGVGQASIAANDLKTAEEYLLKASEAFEKLVPEEQRSKQNFPASWIGLIHLYMLNENYPKAQETIEKVLKYDSQSEEMKKILEQAKKKDNSEIKKLFGK
jgi:tetratricopeptide (TPR) repeat protein